MNKTFFKRNVANKGIGLLFAVILIFQPNLIQSQYDPLVATPVYIQAAGAYNSGSNLGFWDIPGYKPKYKQGQNIQVWAKDDGDDRKFVFYPDKQNPGYYYIVPYFAQKNGARIDVSGNKKANGTNVQIWIANTSPAQRFSVKYLPNGNVKIYNKNGQALCLDNRSYSNGTNVHTWEDHEGDWMEWVLIDAKTGNAMANGIPLPMGKVVVPQGYKVEDVEISFFSNKYTKPLVTRPNSVGEFSFPDADVKDEYVAVLLAAADGLISDSYQYHKTIRAGKLVLNLKAAPEGTQLVKSFNRGNILYKKGSNYWINSQGNINSDDNFFFSDLSIPTNEKKELVKAMGVSGVEAKTDKEIYEITKKCWQYFSNNTKSIFGNNGDKTELVKQVLKEYTNAKGSGPVEYWTTVEQFMQMNKKYGFIAVGNCSSTALAFAAFLRTAGVPANKMAVERLLYDWYRDHWAVLVEIKGQWFWFDPTYAGYGFPTYENLVCIPTSRAGFNYDLPYELITLPGSTINYVPYCGIKGKL